MHVKGAKHQFYIRINFLTVTQPDFKSANILHPFHDGIKAVDGYQEGMVKKTSLFVWLHLIIYSSIFCFGPRVILPPPVLTTCTKTHLYHFKPDCYMHSSDGKESFKASKLKFLSHSIHL